MAMSTSNLVKIIALGVNACSILSRSHGRRQRGGRGAAAPLCPGLAPQSQKAGAAHARSVGQTNRKVEIWRTCSIKNAKKTKNIAKSPKFHILTEISVEESNGGA